MTSRPAGRGKGVGMPGWAKARDEVVSEQQGNKETRVDYCAKQERNGGGLNATGLIHSSLTSIASEGQGRHMCLCV